MSQRYIGSSISPTAAPTSSASTTGVWSINDQYQAKNAGNWPVYTPPPTTDPYFGYVSMLLPGNGTNGAQNNTFLDSSTNNFTITRNGNTTQGTASPYYSCWSVLTTSGNSLLSPTNSAFTYAGNFTLECWAFSMGGSPQMFFDYSAGNFGVLANTTTGFTVYLSSGVTFSVTDKTLPIGVWTHIALVRSGSTIKLYVNGVASTTTATNSATLGNGTMSIGGNTSSGVYISNFRANTTAVYTTTFTPSTAPLTAIPGTVSLIGQSNRFVDNSPLNLAWTRQGTPSVQKFSPFEPVTVTPASYSGYFDGTGDYLSTPYNSQFSIGTDAITIEAWLYVREWKSAGILSCAYNTNFHVHTAPTAHAGVLYFYIAGSVIYVTLANAPALNTWFHIAFVRESGGAAKIYVNGVAQATGTLSGNGSTTSPLYVGASSHSLGENFSGDISNLRFVKGTAVYTSNFTPPTAPLTAISGTVLLTCQSTTFIDNSTNAFPLTVVGNAQPITATSFTPTTSAITPYAAATNGGSAYFDGSGDYLSNTVSSVMNFGTGDFTVEYWQYYTVALNSNFQVAIGSPDSGSNIAFGTNVSGVVYATTSTTGYTASGSIVPNAWQHIAWVRSSGTLKAYLNGVQVFSGSVTTSFDNVGFGIGGSKSGSFLLAGGYLSNIRIVKGTAVYTSAFVPPAAPVTAITNTALLVNATNGGIIDNASINDLETIGNAQISTTQSKFGGSSMYFDGTGDWLVTPSNVAYKFSTGDFTVEGWFYNSSGTNGGIFQIASTAGGFGAVTGLALGVKSNKYSLYYNNGSSADSTGLTISANAWHHFAVVKSSNITKVYLDGVLDTGFGSAGSITDSTNYSGTYITVGGYYSSTYLWIGYIDDLRITNGYARYTTNFTPPTVAFPTA